MRWAPYSIREPQELPADARQGSSASITLIIICRARSTLQFCCTSENIYTAYWLNALRDLDRSWPLC